MVLFWFNVLISLIALINGECNYFLQQDWEYGIAQPIGRCIAQYSNTISTSYTCSDNGDMVTAKRFTNSVTCDDASTGIESAVYTSSNATFVCDGDNSCDLCYRLYKSCDDTSISNAQSESCFINKLCVDTTGDQTETTESGRVECTSKTAFKATQYYKSRECDSSLFETNTIEEGCFSAARVYYEMLTTPCTNQSNFLNIITNFIFVAFVILFK